MAHHTLTTNVEIEAYLHRTRMAMLEAFCGKPGTVSQIAERLGVHPANLTRHMRCLERAGLVTLIEKRDTGRNLEKYYAAAADSFDVAPEAGTTNAHKAALAMVRSDLSASLASLPDEDPGEIFALLTYARISRHDTVRFAERLAELAAEFQACATDRGDAYHLNLSLYPSDRDVPPNHNIRLPVATAKS